MEEWTYVLALIFVALNSYRMGYINGMDRGWVEATNSAIRFKEKP